MPLTSILSFMRLILGSQSPRRKEILSFFSYPFVQIASAFDEDSVSFLGDPAAYALELAQKKAQELAGRFPGDIVLTADTVVYFGKKIFNKPRDKAEATGMLHALSGNWHEVYTGVAVCTKNGVYTGSEKTKILFHPLTDEQIEQYLISCTFLDKAGSYAIQQAGSILISEIEGCYYNVMGLPINVVKDLLSKVGINLWHYLKPF